MYIKMWPMEEPNKDLKAETYLSYDAGIEVFPAEDLSFDVTGYKIISDNKIAKSGPGWTNLDEFDYYGMELSSKYTMMKMIGLRAGYSFIDNEYDDQKLAYVPKHKLIGEISFNRYNIYAGLNVEYVKDVWADTSGSNKLSNYIVLNGKIAYTFLEKYRAFVNLNNLTDKDYETYLNYPMPGFTVLGGVSVTF